MNYFALFMAFFAILGAIDRILGNRFGIGKEFEKGFMLLGSLALSMIGMIIISPAIAKLMAPCFDFVYNTLHIDPSLIPASLFANDMGGAPLALEVTKNESIGMFNALVVSSMMGCTISFTIPVALSSLNKEKHNEFILGLLCGVVTIPIGCLISGLFSVVPLSIVLLNLLPLLIFSLLVAGGLIFFPKVCIKIFNLLGIIIKIIITVGLALGILKFLTGIEPIKGLASIEEGAIICLNAAIVMSGAFPFLFILSKLLSKPMKKVSEWLKISDTSTLGFVSTLANNVTTFEMMNSMDSKGAVLNSAFAVSASFVFADHLAFTMAFDASYIPQMIVAKFISGFSALLFAIVIYKRVGKTATS